MSLFKPYPTSGRTYVPHCQDVCVAQIHQWHSMSGTLLVVPNFRMSLMVSTSAEFFTRQLMYVCPSSGANLTEILSTSLLTPLINI